MASAARDSKIAERVNWRCPDRRDFRRGSLHRDQELGDAVTIAFDVVGDWTRAVRSAGRSLCGWRTECRTLGVLFFFFLRPSRRVSKQTVGIERRVMISRSRTRIVIFIQVEISRLTNQCPFGVWWSPISAGGTRPRISPWPIERSGGAWPVDRNNVQEATGLIGATTNAYRSADGPRTEGLLGDSTDKHFLRAQLRFPS